MGPFPGEIPSLLQALEGYSLTQEYNEMLQKPSELSTYMLHCELLA